MKRTALRAEASIARDHRADLPAQFVQTPAKGAADAACTDDRQSTSHVMLG